ncbi:MAG: prepilin-type N-terminal cleavage/methylation domain-containing protein [Planctomycetes bacterium]|nr:prepilin-type N-terminal cleavage/methylation domain-containing protein [Planctomycetota bacterium]
MSKKSSHFTLIELMVVMTIIAILSGIGIAAYKDGIIQAKRTASNRGLSQLVTSILAKETMITSIRFSKDYQLPKGIRSLTEDEENEINEIAIGDVIIESTTSAYKMFAGYNENRPFDDPEGYYFFCAVESSGNVKKRIDSEARVAMEVYDWTSNGDNNVGVCFADGTVHTLKVTTPPGEIDLVEVLSRRGKQDGYL